MDYRASTLVYITCCFLPLIYLRYSLFWENFRFSPRLTAAGVLGVVGLGLFGIVQDNYLHTPMLMTLMGIVNFIYALIVLKIPFYKQFFTFILLGCYGQLLIHLSVIVSCLFWDYQLFSWLMVGLFLLFLILSYGRMHKFLREYVLPMLTKGKHFVFWVASFGMAAGYSASFLAYYPFSSPKGLLLLISHGCIDFICLSCAVLTVYLYSSLQQQKALQGELRTALWLYNSEKRYYDLIKDNWLKTRQNRHDLRHHLLTIRQMAAEEKYEDIVAYLQQFSTYKQAEGGKNKEILQEIVTYWQKQARQQKIAVEISWGVPTLYKQKQDILVFLNALFKDMITAAAEAGAAHPKFYIRTVERNKNVYLESGCSCPPHLAELYALDVEAWQIYKSHTEIDRMAHTMQCNFDGQNFTFSMILRKN